MSYPNLRECVDDLHSKGELLIIDDEVDPYLEMAEIQRQVYRKSGPAVYFTNVKGTPFPCVSNLFGTEKRWRTIFAQQLGPVEAAIQFKADPASILHNFKSAWQLPFTGLKSLPRKTSSAPVLKNTTTISSLPKIVSWPDDGGAFITLPQVLSQMPGSSSIMQTNVGMYRVQLDGGKYQKDKEIGLHYQIHRGLGIHHSLALQRGEDLAVSIFVGGPPAHTVAGVMPLPEGLSELVFAGMLAGRRFRYQKLGSHIVSADADFCITGWIRGNRTLPEGPFGDHLGYYSLTHPFPVLEVENVYHRDDAIWPFTVVGRPPQEDTSFGKLIHQITKPMVPAELPGVRALHAVDESGVHPLLLAVGSERYTSSLPKRPMELLTQANAILGFNQCSLAKYLFIVNGDDNPGIDCSDVAAFFAHLLERVDWSRDLHFQTQTTMDTLDYTGGAINQGSKLVIASCGGKQRELVAHVPESLCLVEGVSLPAIILPGILVVQADKFEGYAETEALIKEWEAENNAVDLDSMPLIVLTEDVAFTARDLSNFLWVTFTRSNPSHDLYGFDAATIHKHWGCGGPLVIDARIKPHHAPPLVEDEAVRSRVERMLQKYISSYFY